MVLPPVESTSHSSRDLPQHSSEMKTHLLFCAFVVAAFSPLLPAMGGEAWLNGQDAVLVIGSPNFTENSSGLSASQLRLPGSVCIDPVSGKIFVSDSGNNRILRFTSFSELSNGAAAEAVFGQPDFVSDTRGNGTNPGLWGPEGIAIGPDGELWVADLNNHRVLRFENAATATSGASADGVLGQPNFTTRAGELDDESLNQPTDVAIDASGNLYVCDTRNTRVLLFRNARALADGSPADTVFGQEDPETNEAVLSASGMGTPLCVSISASGHLYVSDVSYTRVLVFESPLTAQDGATADRVIGQVDFESRSDGISSTEYSEPHGLAFTPQGALWLADSYNQRVLRLGNADTLSGVVAASTVIGQPDMLTSGSEIGPTSLHYTGDIATDSEGRLYVVDGPRARILVFDISQLQPDATVGKQAGSQFGNGIYNLSGTGQAQNIKSHRRKTRCFYTVGNDGTVDDVYRIHGRGTNSKFHVKHFRTTGGKANITATVKTGQHLESIPNASGVFAYMGEFKRKDRDRRGRFSGFLQSTSISDGEADRSTLRIKYRP